MELAGGGADDFIEALFDVHMDVFELRAPGKSAGFDLLADAAKPVDDEIGLAGGDDSLSGKHPRVGDRAGDILSVEPTVVVDGDGIIGGRIHGREGPRAMRGALGARKRRRKVITSSPRWFLPLLSI